MADIQVFPMYAGKLTYPYHVSLALEKDFRMCVRDIIERTGVAESDIKKILDDNEKKEQVYQEFAKCFVPQAVDGKNNYEFYEIYGDLSLNKAMIGYLFRVLHPRLSQIDSKVSLGYFDKLKAYYISKKFYADLSRTIGFDEFVNRVVHSHKESERHFMGEKEKTIEDLHEDVMEAFIGCLELQLDTYIGMHRGYVYVSNFIYDLISDIDLSLDPADIWSPAILLKETNDAIVAYNSKNPYNKLRFYHVLPAGQGFYRLVSSAELNARDQTVQEVPNTRSRFDDIKEASAALSRIALTIMRQQPTYSGVIKSAPTPESLNIADLVKSK
jgi:dsRNA-specific ribonuclease